MLQARLDGTAVGMLSVPATSWTEYRLPLDWTAGEHRLELSFVNDHGAVGCGRNLWLDRVAVVGDGSQPVPAPTTSPAPAPSPTASPVPAAADSSGNPFTGARAYVDPYSSARREADVRRTWDPLGAAALDKIASSSAAAWYGDWNPTETLAATVSARVGAVTAAGALPVLVAYDIPHRDCAAATPRAGRRRRPPTARGSGSWPRVSAAARRWWSLSRTRWRSSTA